MELPTKKIEEMPVPKNSTSTNSTLFFVSKMFQVPVSEEKLMRFQYVWDKDNDFFKNM